MNAPGGEGVARRDMFRLGAGLATGAGAAWLAPAPAAADPATVLRLREGSNLCAAPDPAGRRVAIDALNALWVLPMAGGRARRLTDDLQDATRPHWSPDGRRLVFQSFREGVYDLWVIGADSTGLTRLTDGPGYDQEPRWSPDGRQIAFSSDRDGASHIWLLDPASGGLRRITDGDHKHAAPVWSADGRRVVHVRDDTVIEEVTVATGARRTLVTASGGAVLHAPALGPGDGRLAYVRVTGPRADLMVGEEAVTSGEDVFPLTPAWLSADELLYTADGGVRRRRLGGEAREVPFSVAVTVAGRDRLRPRSLDVPSHVQGIAGPVLSPDARRVAFRALNALWILTIGERARRVVADGYFNSDPDWSPDGRSLVYVSDRSGTANLWRYDLATGESHRLTDLPDAQLTPRWSPDGGRIAYQDESGATWVLTLADGSVTKVLPALYQPGRPTWSPDGTVLALAAVRPVSRRGSTGLNEILTVDLRTHRIRYQPAAPGRSLSTRGDDGPVWTRDGHLVVGMESLAWRIPVDGTGTITGPPRRLTDEVTDSLSVSADGRTLLYLRNGDLRTTSMESGPPRTIRTGLVAPRRRRAERTVIRAGALWDGRSTRLRRDVDIVVEDERITALVPRGDAPPGRVVDATTLTVMPGLIDTHVHWHLRGRQWGDRQGRLWLAYGVTTVRSPGDPAYQMVETREALACGTRIGPRLYGCGEALDGTRIYYNFMRPVTSRAQLDRELERAFGLRYDLVKSYMRLPVSLERRVVERAHARGVPVTSHYLYPAARTGLDGMEHTGGGNRLGYSRTLSYAAGRTASDSVALLAASGMWVSSTTIFADELYTDDRSLIEDERTRVLFPAWEYRRLREKADAASGPEGDLHRAWNQGDVDMLLRVHRAGGLVIAGSDAPLDDPGIGLHQNLRAMVKYGFTPYEALTTATGNAARALGLEDVLGVVAPGFRADLVCVAGDPLRDIGAAASVRRVVAGGVVHTIPDLLEPFRRASVDSARRNRVRPAAPSAAPRSAEHYWHRPEWESDRCCARR
ncbi:MAG TPA: amidohydrolase family protein [Thermomonospora sp.]|nr:amidohydrolase family protein [Thermomonospora sp.]